MKITTALAAEENSTNALLMPGIMLMIGDISTMQPETTIALAGTLRSDTSASRAMAGESESCASWYRWRPAEYSSELSDEAAAVITTKNTSAAAQSRPAYLKTMMNGDG